MFILIEKQEKTCLIAAFSARYCTISKSIYSKCILWGHNLSLMQEIRVESWNPTRVHIFSKCVVFFYYYFVCFMGVNYNSLIVRESCNSEYKMRSTRFRSSFSSVTWKVSSEVTPLAGQDIACPIVWDYSASKGRWVDGLVGGFWKEEKEKGQESTPTLSLASWMGASVLTSR